MKGVASKQDVIDLYVSKRLSAAKVARQLGIRDHKAREILREAGVLRKVGVQPRDLDAARIRDLRKKHRLSWAQIAAGMGASENAVQYAYRQAYGNNGEVDLYNHLTGVQAGELGNMWDNLPRAANGGVDWRSQEMKRLLDLVAFHVKRGVTRRECARAMGVPESSLGYLLRDHA